MLDQMPSVIVHDHLNQDVSWKNLRSVVFFCPFLISTTSSIGTRMRPNLDCIPARLMRSMMLRSTAFSRRRNTHAQHTSANPDCLEPWQGLSGGPVHPTGWFLRHHSLFLPPQNQVIKNPLKRLICEPQKQHMIKTKPKTCKTVI